MTSDTDLVDRLVALPTAEPIPREEWEWLAAHGALESHAAGEFVTSAGTRIEVLWIVLSGHVVVTVDRGAGPRRAVEWRAGDITGRLPFSRMSVAAPERTVRTEVASEVLVIHEREFPELIRRCPMFTALCVHQMVDRTRSFKTSDLQDEKMISLGKLAAGLAHELNNPASATVRAAHQLLAGLAEAEAASESLGAAGAPREVLDTIRQLRTACLGTPGGTTRSALEQADHEDAIAGWLAHHGLDGSLTAVLADSGASLELLDGLAEQVPHDMLDVAVRFIATGCSTRALALEIQRSATRVADLVAAVKRFTYMDSRTGSAETVVDSGLRDTIRVLSSKGKARGVTVRLDVEPDLPTVRANGDELNQVWMNLIDNALDAAPTDGAVTVDVRRDVDHVVVRVTDDGPGIPADLVDRIFDPFFTTKPPGQGTGLGLEITRRLVRHFHGEIAVDSRPGRTTFCVRLPVAESLPSRPPVHS